MVHAYSNGISPKYSSSQRRLHRFSYTVQIQNNLNHEIPGLDNDPRIAIPYDLLYRKLSTFWNVEQLI
jgi:hypothetical protein